MQECGRSVRIAEAVEVDKEGIGKRDENDSAQHVQRRKREPENCPADGRAPARGCDAGSQGLHRLLPFRIDCKTPGCFLTSLRIVRKT